MAVSSARTPVPLVLVTGATGSIGPTVIQQLCNQGYRVRALVRSVPASGVLPPDVELRTGELGQRAAIQAAMQGVDIVMHLAAFLHVTHPTPEQQSLYHSVNVEGTCAVVEAAQQCGVQRLVYFSTVAVYGKNRNELLNEDSVLHPNTLYGQSKLEGEQIVLAAQNDMGEPLGVVLRLSTVYGPALKGVYRQLLLALKRGRFVPLGDGSNLRSLVFDQDVAQAAVLVAREPRAAGQVYNVTDGQLHTQRTIMEAMCQALGRPYPRVVVPVAAVRWGLAGLQGLARYSANAARLAGIVEKYTATVAIDGSRLQRDLGFCPTFDLERGWRAVAAALPR